MVKILAFDVGIKNLSYCLIEDESILDWDLINLVEDGKTKKNDLHELSSILFHVLKEKFEHIDIDHIIIENQPVLKNPTMKSIQMLIYSYFAYLKHIEQRDTMGINFIGASTKVKLAEKILKEKAIEMDKCSSKYQYNKKISIKCTSELLLNTNEELHDFFISHKKKDDLADCYLLALVKFYKT